MFPAGSCGSLALQVRVDGRPGDAEHVGDLLHYVLLAVVELPGELHLRRAQLRLPAALPASRTGRCQAVPGALSGLAGGVARWAVVAARAVSAWLAGYGLKYDRLP
jgi:hypothetical protein